MAQLYQPLSLSLSLQTARGLNYFNYGPQVSVTLPMKIIIHAEFPRILRYIGAYMCVWVKKRVTSVERGKSSGATAAQPGDQLRIKTIECSFVGNV